MKKIKNFSILSISGYDPEGGRDCVVHLAMRQDAFEILKNAEDLWQPTDGCYYYIEEPSVMGYLLEDAFTELGILTVCCVVPGYSCYMQPFHELTGIQLDWRPAVGGVNMIPIQKEGES